ncbi:hypothetical protein NM208_g9033 [Fusarium decemcellulare]|uniref:Uncharacterized protein n=1 Tax=Fusarium decemcellulare TaxID=57161 RepID=A0ACC1S3N3_9HYPO|nr:hypothetical protein NM208_g9033 [Fusarium decemcellulare]
MTKNSIWIASSRAILQLPVKSVLLFLFRALGHTGPTSPRTCAAIKQNPATDAPARMSPSRYLTRPPFYHRGTSAESAKNKISHHQILDFGAPDFGSARSAGSSPQPDSPESFVAELTMTLVCPK